MSTTAFLANKAHTWLTWRGQEKGFWVKLLFDRLVPFHVEFNGIKKKEETAQFISQMVDVDLKENKQL